MNREKSVALIDQEVVKEDNEIKLSKEEEQHVKIIENKLSNHPVKKIGKLLNPKLLGTIQGMLKKYFKTQLFQNENTYKIELKLVTVHTGIKNINIYSQIKRRGINSKKEEVGVKKKKKIFFLNIQYKKNYNFFFQL